MKRPVHHLLHQQGFPQVEEHVHDGSRDADEQLRVTIGSNFHRSVNAHGVYAPLHRVEKNGPNSVREDGKRVGEKGAVPVRGGGVAEVVRGVDDKEGVNLLVKRSGEEGQEGSWRCCWRSG